MNVTLCKHRSIICAIENHFCYLHSEFNCAIYQTASQGFLKLKEIPNGVSNCGRLKMLSIKNSGLESLPADLFLAPHLSRLHCSGLPVRLPTHWYQIKQNKHTHTHTNNQQYNCLFLKHREIEFSKYLHKNIDVSLCEYHEPFVYVIAAFPISFVCKDPQN